MDGQNDSNQRIVKYPLRDFVGLEDADENVKKAMTNFSYLSAIGNMDEAFKAIKTIKRYFFYIPVFYNTVFFYFYDRLEIIIKPLSLSSRTKNTG